MSDRVDIVDKLDRLIQSGNTPGCNIWLCMVTSTLAAARREIVRLRTELERSNNNFWKDKK